MAITGVDPCFIDTDVLLAACDESREAHTRSLELLEDGLSGKRSLFASGQVLREFLVVATRPVDANGLGMKAADALANLAEFVRCVRLLDETEAVSWDLRDLVRKHGLRGKRIHDANIAATLRAHGLQHLATNNPSDFKIFSGIAVI